MVYKHPYVLLGMKKRGFGVGRWNGFGGKIEEGENMEEAAKREVLEEAGIIINNIEKIGIVSFEFKDESKSVEVHIFRSVCFCGEPKESEEMKPEWFHINSLPTEEMWPADVYWLPFFICGKKFKGRFVYDHPSTKEHTSNIIFKELLETEKI